MLLQVIIKLQVPSENLIAVYLGKRNALAARYMATPNALARFWRITVKPATVTNSTKLKGKKTHKQGAVLSCYG